ncbi:hypothetical protein SAMN05444376_1823 [Bacteroides clarus YIT 12056]|nr:hypothetical protein SAMN05444376_1823 [Bacteroides clarus YIT 12056]
MVYSYIIPTKMCMLQMFLIISPIFIIYWYNKILYTSDLQCYIL